MEILGIIAYWILVYVGIAVFWACIPMRWRYYKAYVWPLDLVVILFLGPHNRDIL